MVTTIVRRPDRAPWSAMAADVVVLPTPPVPVVTTIFARSTTCASDRSPVKVVHPSDECVGQYDRLCGTDGRAEKVGQLDLRKRQRIRKAGELFALTGVARRPPPPGLAQRRQLRLGHARGVDEIRGIAVDAGKVRQDTVDDHRAERDPQLILEP